MRRCRLIALGLPILTNACFNPGSVPMQDTETSAGSDSHSGPTTDDERDEDADARPPTCGDRVVDPGEECDDGNERNDDACLANCRTARCGDGQVWLGVELCDDGNRDNTDDCTNDCRTATCGDGYVHALTEDCDDGNRQDGDTCPATCQLESASATVADTTGSTSGLSSPSDSGPTSSSDAGLSSSSDSGLGDDTSWSGDTSTTDPETDARGRYTSGDWSGCVWTVTDDDGVGTTISPDGDDIALDVIDGPICVSGTIGAHPEYASFAGLGYNLADPAEQPCYGMQEDTTDPTAVIPTLGGIALSYELALEGTLVRPYIYGYDDAANIAYWCTDPLPPNTSLFIPFTEFRTDCWDVESTAYNGEPLTSLMFLVPGTTSPTPFDFCIEGFREGNSSADAP